MKKTKLKPVEVVFWDHCQHSGALEEVKPIKCQIIGYLAKETNLALYCMTWLCNQDANEENNEWYCILKSAIISRKEL